MGSMKSILILLSALMFSCSSSITLQNTIPYETQQLIKTVKENSDVNFKYVPNPKGEVKDGRLHYSINPAFEGMLNELIQTKFNSISEISDNRLIVNLKEVFANDDVGTYNVTHNLKMAVDVSLIRNKNESTRSITYSTSFVLDDPNYERKSIEDLLLKFIVAIDKFIDTEFEVQ